MDAMILCKGAGCDGARVWDSLASWVTTLAVVLGCIVLFSPILHILNQRIRFLFVRFIQFIFNRSSITLDQAAERFSNARGVPLSAPGAIIGTRITGINLDGLTIIPLTNLIPIKVKIPITLPFIKKSIAIIEVVVSSRASETVFSTLRLSTVSVLAPDTFRQPTHVELVGLDSTLSSSVAWLSTVHVHIGSHQWKVLNARGSARLACSVLDSKASVALRLVNPSYPRVAVASSYLDAGNIKSIELSYCRWSSLINHALRTSVVKDTALLRAPIMWIANYFISQVLDAPGIDLLARDVITFGKAHIDIDMWKAITDSERSYLAVVGIGASLTGKGPVDVSQSEAKAPSKEDASCLQGTADAPSNEDASCLQRTKTPFSFGAHFVGGTILHSFPLPSFSPLPPRPEQTRTLLQSLNPLAGPLSLLCTDVLLSRISFSSVAIRWDTTTSELVITLEEFSATLSSIVEISATIPQLVTRITSFKDIKASAKASTIVESRSLQLRFSQPPNQCTLSPFTAITPMITFPSVRSTAFLALGVEAMNGVLAAVKAQIAVAASLVVGKFVREKVGDWLGEAMDRASTALMERGIEWSRNDPSNEKG